MANADEIEAEGVVQDKFIMRSIVKLDQVTWLWTARWEGPAEWHHFVLDLACRITHAIVLYNYTANSMYHVITESTQFE